MFRPHTSRPSNPDAKTRSIRLRSYAARVAGTCAALLFLVGSGTSASAQQNVRGIVVDASTSQPLAGAQVVIDGTGRGAITGANGRFLFEDVTGTEIPVRVVLIGYRDWTGAVTPGITDLRIALEQRALALDELIVTGTPGGQQLRSLGNSVAQIEAAELQQIAPAPDLESLLGGQVAGVQVLSGSGEIGGGSNIQIRGARSLALSGQPLVYIDGVRVNNDNADTGGACGVATDCGTPPSRLNDINPDNIASIEVIKGPAASTLYGTEASNGVINIITKKGTRGGPFFTFTMRQGANWLPDPEELFPSTYFRCQGISSDCTAGEVVEFNVLREDRI
ncbi:MAG: TonB-dependent receptor plug domain-containing protein, partial [Longimicrobiales bacterium]